MYAVIESGGQQFKVATGKMIKLEKLPGEVGSEVTLDKVLMVKTDDDLKVGNPYLENVKVSGEIVAQDRHKKIIVFKFRKRKGYRRKNGHRQPFTQIKINSIEV